ncbi:MAG: hypothetical protein EOP68_17945 [Sphingomonas sp.]|jgi:hypothetical protein|nr:MAG: hypothetical protein EOP68_17945 [Sphingomonas sp.]
MANPLILFTIPLFPAMLLVGEGGPRVVQSWSIHERVVVRVPRMSAAARAQVAPIEWKESKAPKCLKLAEVGAATIAAPASIDLLMSDGRRLRARLDGDCRSADFYSGFYVRPGRDGKLCADRDAIRIRSGAACQIDRFRLLTQKR